MDLGHHSTMGGVAAGPALVESARKLRVSLGQHSDRGRKEINQDFHGACVPADPLLADKGIVLALADGVSSSEVSQEASQAAVAGFLDDYYSTSPAWTVKKSARQVMVAINSWLNAQTRQSPYRYERERGYVCTLTVLVLRSNTAHVFHVGDARVYLLRGGTAEQLTQDHRVWIGAGQSLLGRALGFAHDIEVDYHSLTLEPGDVFYVATDGVYEHVQPAFVSQTIDAHPSDLDAAARALAAEALARGSEDNLTVQLLRVDELPEPGVAEAQRQRSTLPFPPAPGPRELLDGYRILRELHSSARSHVYLAEDAATGSPATPVVLKTLATDLQGDPAAVDRFLLEEWVARRVDNMHVARAADAGRPRNYLYTVMEFIDGQTLAQWMADHPRPELEAVRRIVEQIARGLMAFHRLEMLHQDLRPANVMLDRSGTVRLIDFGSTRVAGLEEIALVAQTDVLGTAQYTAPEYFLGEGGTPQSDLFALGVITYQLLSGRLPYGTSVAGARTRSAQRRLTYRSVLDDERDIPAWIDDVLRKATHVDPLRRYEELSEFIHDLRHPNPAYLRRTRPPLLERDPARFWRGVALLLAVVVVVLIATGA